MAPRRRKPRSAPPPTSREDVPRWLTENYGISFIDGVPDLEDWHAAVARADDTRGSNVLWQEDLLMREAEANDQSSPMRAKAKAMVTRAERALRAGRAYPRVHDVALSEFMIALLIRRELPFEAIAMLAWWKGYLTNDPRNPDAARALQRLVERRWNGTGRLDGNDF